MLCCLGLRNGTLDVSTTTVATQTTADVSAAANVSKDPDLTAKIGQLYSLVLETF